MRKQKIIVETLSGFSFDFRFQIYRACENVQAKVTSGSKSEGTQLASLSGNSERKIAMQDLCLDFHFRT